MNATKDKVLIAYHDHCIDGFTSYWITSKELRDRGSITLGLAMEYNETSYDELDTFLKVNPDVNRLFVVDFSLPLATLVYYRFTFPGLEIVILDHHKTAFKMYAPEEAFTSHSKLMDYIAGAHVILDNTQSGAGICWNYFNPGQPLPKLIKYVQDYDLWKFEYGNETKYVNKYLKAVDKILGAWEAIATNMERSEDLLYILDVGKKLQGKHNAMVDAIVDTSYVFTINGYIGRAVTGCDYKYISDVGHALAEICGTFGAIYTVYEAANTIKWSLRSIGDFDVSKIAEAYGGGGHKNAAGFETKLLNDVEVKYANSI